MKIIVLHGQDSAKSYDRLMKFTDSAKKRGWEIINDDFPNTPSLFGTDSLIIYRDYKLLTKRDIKNFAKFDGTLVVYHDSDLPQTFLKQMPKDFKMEKFDLPKLLFVFLDSLYSGNSQNALKLLHEVVKTEPVELVMYFIARHARDLYWAKIDASSMPVPSWRVAKLKSQALKYSGKKLEHFVSSLADIDSEVKLSKADLLTSLDLLIVEQLE